METVAFAASGLLVGVAVAARRELAPRPWSVWALLLAGLALAAGLVLTVVA